MGFTRDLVRGVVLVAALVPVGWRIRANHEEGLLLFDHPDGSGAQQFGGVRKPHPDT